MTKTTTPRLLLLLLLPSTGTIYASSHYIQFYSLHILLVSNGQKEE